MYEDKKYVRSQEERCTPLRQTQVKSLESGPQRKLQDDQEYTKKLLSQNKKQKQNKIATVIIVTHSNLQRNPSPRQWAKRHLVGGGVLVSVKGRAGGSSFICFLPVLC